METARSFSVSSKQSLLQRARIGAWHTTTVTCWLDRTRTETFETTSARRFWGDRVPFTTFVGAVQEASELGKNLSSCNGSASYWRRKTEKKTLLLSATKNSQRATKRLVRQSLIADRATRGRLHRLIRLQLCDESLGIQTPRVAMFMARCSCTASILCLWALSVI